MTLQDVSNDLPNITHHDQFYTLCITDTVVQYVLSRSTVVLDDKATALL